MKDRSVVEAALALVKQGVLSVDEQGRIWRHYIACQGQLQKLAEPRRAENPGAKGYLRVAIWLDKRVRNIAAHRVVWELANGPIPDLLEINHKNGIKTDNQLSNIEVVTSGENGAHAHRTGLRQKAYRACGKLGKLRRGKLMKTDEELRAVVSALQEQRARGGTLSEVADRFDISASYASELYFRETGDQYGRRERDAASGRY